MTMYYIELLMRVFVASATEIVLSEKLNSVFLDFIIIFLGIAWCSKTVIENERIN